MVQPDNGKDIGLRLNNEVVVRTGRTLGWIGMATAANTIPSAMSFCRTISSPSASSSLSSPSFLPIQFLPFRKPPSFSSSACTSLRLERLPSTRKLRSFVVAAAAEVGETLVPEGEPESAALQPEGEPESAAPEPEGDESSPPSTTDQTVSVTVSPSDVLTMFFQAEGSINDAAIPTVTKALEETEGISDLRVQVAEGIATVQLTKQTTVQATGVASNLVELIQSKGFKLQTLNLSFQDEEDFS